MFSNPDPNLNYSVANIFANRWLNIEYDDHLLYWVKGKSNLSARVFNNKVQNWLIMYLEGQKRNSSNKIIKLKEPWTGFILYPDQLHSRCHFPKEMTE